MFKIIKFIFETTLFNVNSLLIKKNIFMKKLILIFAVVAFVSLNSSKVMAQVKMPSSTSKLEAPSVGTDDISSLQTLFKTDDVQSKVKDQLLKNDDLQSKAIDFLKSDSATKSQITDLLKSNSGAKAKVMEYVLKNPELTKKVMGWISSNPEILKQAMSLIGM